MPQPTTDPKKTIRTIIIGNISVDDDQGVPVAVTIAVSTAHPDKDRLDIPTIVIELIDENVMHRSVGYQYVYMADIYALTLYAVDLDNSTNIIDAESLLNKMKVEIKRIFNDRSLAVSPTVNINIIKYLGGGEEVLAGVNPTIWVGMHVVQVEYSF